MSAIFKGAVAAFVLGLLVGAYGFWEMSIQSRFATEAVVVTGRVGSAVPDGSATIDSHVVWYTDKRGNEHFMVVDIPVSLVEGWGDARYGDQIEVEYLETDPSRARLADDHHSPAWLWLVPAGALLGLSFIGFSAARNWVTNPDGTVTRVYESV